MEEDDVGLGELLSCLFGDTYVVVFMQGGCYKSNFIIVNDFGELFLRLEELLGVALTALEANLDAGVALVELDLIFIGVTGLLNLLEEMLTVQPDHLDWR